MSESSLSIYHARTILVVYSDVRRMSSLQIATLINRRKTLHENRKNME